MTESMLSSFQRMLPSMWPKLHSVLQFYGYSPIITGGAVRDYFLFGKMSNDWDIELRHSYNSFNRDDWKSLGKELSKLGKVTYLPFEIIRLDCERFQFEFSPPRKEKFSENWNELGHSNFDAVYDFQYPFNKTVLRRDFTINAIGLKFVSKEQIEILDPLNGILHLKAGELHTCGPDFEKDPVRFLRAIRFSVKLNFQLSPELLFKMQKMEIHGDGQTYLWSELQKSEKPLNMYFELLKWSEKKTDLFLPIKGPQILRDWPTIQNFIFDPSKHEAWLMGFEWCGVDGGDWQKFFKLSSESFLRLRKWVKNTSLLLNLRPEFFHGDFDKVIGMPEFDTLFDWYFSTKQMLQKDMGSVVLPFIDNHVSDWIFIFRFEPIKDLKHIEPPLRAKYQLWNLCQKI